jgi:ABC-type multidrug transport system fused ATPase/permease subunit
MNSILKLARTRIVSCVLAVGAIGLTAAAMLWANAQLAVIIDAASAGRPPDAASLARMLAAMFALCFANYAAGCGAGYAGEIMTHDLRMGYARHFASLPFAESVRLNAGEQLSILQNEIAGVSAYLNAGLFALLGDAVRFFATVAWLLTINPVLTVAANLPAFIILTYVMWSSKVIDAATERSQQAMGEMNGFADTLLTMFPIIRLYDASRMILGGYEGAAASWKRHAIRSERVTARLMSLSGVLSGIPLLILFMVGGRMAMGGALSIGTLYIFLNLSGNVSGALMNMPRHIASFRRFAANMRRMDGKICL